MHRVWNRRTPGVRQQHSPQCPTVAGLHRLLRDRRVSQEGIRDHLQILSLRPERRFANTRVQVGRMARFHRKDASDQRAQLDIVNPGDRKDAGSNQLLLQLGGLPEKRGEGRPTRGSPRCPQ
jgi:hypothetical protein